MGRVYGFADIRGRPKLFKPRRMGWTDMHTDLDTREVKRLDPKDKDAVEM